MTPTAPSIAPAAVIRRLGTPLLLLGLGPLACSDPAPPPPHTPARGVPAASASAAASAAVPPPPFDLNELRNAKTVVPRAPSDHAGGTVDVEIAANSAAAPYPNLSASSSLSEGALLVARLFAKGASEASVSFVMVKRASGWEYLVIEPSGSIRARGDLPLCVRCHAEASIDHVFAPRVP